MRDGLEAVSSAEKLLNAMVVLEVDAENGFPPETCVFLSNNGAVFRLFVGELATLQALCRGLDWLAGINLEPAQSGTAAAPSFAELILVLARQRWLALLRASKPTGSEIVSAFLGCDVAALRHDELADNWDSAIAEVVKLEKFNASLLRVQLSKERQRATAGRKTPRKAELDGRVFSTADFATVTWHGEELAFTRNQAAAVRMLWPLLGTNQELSGEHVIEEIEANGRFDHLFRGSLAWKRLIVPGQRKGHYRLADPLKRLPEVPSQKSLRKKRSGAK